jgi:hypothetical protein
MPTSKWGEKTYAWHILTYPRAKCMCVTYPHPTMKGICLSNIPIMKEAHLLLYSQVTERKKKTCIFASTNTWLSLSLSCLGTCTSTNTWLFLSCLGTCTCGGVELVLWVQSLPKWWGKIWSTVINIKFLTNSNQQTQSYEFTSHITAFLSVGLITKMLVYTICKYNDVIMHKYMQLSLGCEYAT